MTDTSRADGGAGQALPEPYYADEWVTLYHGDALQQTAWLTAEVLVTDPPYGVGWRRGLNRARGSKQSAGIANDGDTATRDSALWLWERGSGAGCRPAAVFGSLYADAPKLTRQTLIWEKPVDAGVVGSLFGFRRDVEAIHLLGLWPLRVASRGSVLRSGLRNSGNPSSPAGRTGHPHAKPLDILCDLIGLAGGWVADPFAGSGSTLVAAKQLGRKAIGVEIEERYCEIAAKRLAQDVLDFGAVS